MRTSAVGNVSTRRVSLRFNNWSIELQASWDYSIASTIRLSSQSRSPSSEKALRPGDNQETTRRPPGDRGPREKPKRFPRVLADSGARRLCFPRHTSGASAVSRLDGGRRFQVDPVQITGRYCKLCTAPQWEPRSHAARVVVSLRRLRPQSVYHAAWVP